jgi:hypothetical protein
MHPALLVPAAVHLERLDPLLEAVEFLRPAHGILLGDPGPALRTSPDAPEDAGGEPRTLSGWLDFPRRGLDSPRFGS